jgi:hypothetical protein
MPDLQQKKSCFIWKHFLCEGLPFFLLHWDFCISKLVYRGKMMHNKEGNALNGYFGPSMQHGQTLEKP